MMGPPSATDRTTCGHPIGPPGIPSAPCRRPARRFKEVGTVRPAPELLSGEGACRFGIRQVWGAARFVYLNEATIASRPATAGGSIAVVLRCSIAVSLLNCSHERGTQLRHRTEPRSHRYPDCHPAPLRLGPAGSTGRGDRARGRDRPPSTRRRASRPSVVLD